MDEGAFLDSVEYQLMEGGARWVADFPESIRKVRMADMDFDMVVKGSTRGRSGYFLSAFAARVTLPDYTVACIVKVAEGSPWDEKGVEQVLGATRRVMKKYDLQWAWLVLAHRGEFTRAAARAVEAIEEKEVGVALVNLNSLQAVRSRNLLGRNIHRILPHGRLQAISKGREVRPGPKGSLQITRLVGLFGGLLVVTMVLNGLSLYIAGGRFLIPPYFFLADMGVAALLSYVFYMKLFQLGFNFDEEGFRLVRGSGKLVQARWEDYDLVSLFHMGGGRYHLTLYRKEDHNKYVDIPASAVKLDPLTFRRKAMEFTAHGKGRYPTL